MLRGPEWSWRGGSGNDVTLVWGTLQIGGEAWVFVGG